MHLYIILFSVLRQRNLPTNAKPTPQMRPATPFPARHGTPRLRMETPQSTPRHPQSSGMRPRALVTPQMNGNYGIIISIIKNFVFF